MRAASFRWFVLPFLVSLVGCAGNTMVPNGEADVPEIPGVDSGLPGDDTGAPPLMCPDGQTRCGDACFDLTSDRAHCGSCERLCGDGESCSSSTCQTSCAAGQTSCGGACVDTASDPAHCGGCDTACSAVQTCAAGACQTAAMCTAGQTDCGGACVDTSIAFAHCGGCGRSCAPGERCTEGACSPSACPAGQTRCGSACVDTAGDIGNCGMCGRSCAAGESCVAGACQSACAAPRRSCPSGEMTVCVDVSSDSANCGACGNACSMGQRCTAGSCACPTGQTACGGRCLDTRTDAANCGACGMACAAGTACSAGRCACPTGQTMCGTRCVNLQTDTTQCGMCGRACPSGSTCNAGACSTVCASGQTQCSGRCVNVQTDAAHCGACGMACAAGTACSAGRCGSSNDARASARVITLGAAETTVTGTTVGATHDGPTVPCGCTSGADVWFRFTLTQREVVYLDTAGSALDTSLLITDSSGAAVPSQSSAGNNNLGLCNDDSGCGSGAGFTSSFNSRTAGVLGAGTWYVAVGGCGTGAFTLRVQHLPTTLGSFFYDNRLQGDGTTSTVLVGTSRIAGTCGGTASGEDVRWFVTCGARQQFFSLCASDGGTYTRSTFSGTDFDPSVYIRSALTGSETACNDDGGTMGGSNCRGTGFGADTANYGSRLNNVTTARGLHGLVVDERSGGSGMSYTLRYIVR
ncbi:MAG: hypothetical protein IPF99_24085 [Deltaproteobacteria bacterium]|nr:hypothetical protein [Deltaproteobacteria bacterium]